MGQAKATKKFEKNKLKDTVQRRKDFAKIKQRNQLKAKKRQRQVDDKNYEHGDDDRSGTGGVEDPPKKKRKVDMTELSNMSVDDFFAGGFEVPNSSASDRIKSKMRSGKNQKAGPSENDVKDADAIEEDRSNSSGDDIDIHKEDLKELAEKDPEFYKYLEQNDSELLDFAKGSDFAKIDDLSGSEEEPDTLNTNSKGNGKGESVEVTKANVAKWTTAMEEQHSLRSARELVLAFRSAVHLNDEEDRTSKYSISDAEVYHDVVTSTLGRLTDVLLHHLPVKELANGKVRMPTETKKFRTLVPMLKSHSVSLQQFIENLSDDETLKIALASVLGLLPYFLSFKKHLRELTKTASEIWSDSARAEATRIGAFLVLRRLALIGDAGIKEDVIRISYQALIKGCRITTIHNISGINLMKNSAVDLWGLVDQKIAYTTGFTFVRQLAIHLRNSIKNNSNDSYKTVYNWQYVHSLDFWSRVLSTHCDTLREATAGKESLLRPLIYPLTQVTLGAMRLIPTAAYFPLRFQLTRSLIRLSQSTNTFIPLATPLYEVLTSAEMKKPAKPSTLKPLDFETNIRAHKGILRTRVYQDGVGEQVAELLSEFFNLWARNIAFPELALPVIVMLKRWLKDVSPRGGQPNSKNKSDQGNKNSKVNGAISLLVQKLEANTRYVEEKRAHVDFAPSDRAGVEGFLKELEWNKTPLGAFVETQRIQREQRKKLVEQGRREEETVTGLEKKQQGQKNRGDFIEDEDD